MRWLLPLLLLVLLAPARPCEERPVINQAEGFLVPPVPVGTPGEYWGTDAEGRRMDCLLTRGLRHSILIGLTVFALGALPGVLLGLWMGWRGRAGSASGELLLLIGLLLVLGPGSYRVVLAAGLALFIARYVAVRVQAVRHEEFIEGARALGGTDWHVLRRHVFPHVRPILPAVLTTALGVTFLWMVELAALGFYDRGGYLAELGSSLGGGVATYTFIPRDPDLGQVISFMRWEWITNPLHLLVPIVLLVLLNLAISDLGRWLGREGEVGRTRKQRRAKRPVQVQASTSRS